ncbi:DUF5984 family protein [Nocardia sp. NPDC049149]|uniref:DUF5984 family protein n=1 Tax=Nocardia sp. NPDC049149 TaxID=3364315 RepID=UPI00371662A4
MIRFHFGLAPIGRVEPWGDQYRTLHWFTLTEGWYCIDLGDHELLRYSDRTTELLRAQAGRQATPQHPYVDYYVARLWEDMLALLPTALEPVPADLVDFIDSASADWSLPETPEAEAASIWYGDHTLDTGYLWFGPHLRWWRTVDETSDILTVAWHHPTDPESEIEFAGPSSGRFSLPTDDFRSAVVEFDRNLMSAVARRVRKFRTLGPPTGIEIDLDLLVHEQRTRTQWLPEAMRRRPETDWDAVRAGARTLRQSTSAAH